MRIDPTNNPTSSVPTPAARPNSRAAESTPATGTTATTSTAPASGFVVTGELASLLAAVRRSPETRAEVVAEITARAATGEFNTPQAAADTAKAIINEANG